MPNFPDKIKIVLPKLLTRHSTLLMMKASVLEENRYIIVKCLTIWISFQVSVCVGSSDQWLCVARLPPSLSEEAFVNLASNYGKVVHHHRLCIYFILYILVYFNLHGDDHCCKESTWSLSRCAPPSWWSASRRAAQRVTGWSSTWATRLRHRRGSWWTTGTWTGSVSRWDLDLWHQFRLWKDVLLLVAFKVDWLNSTHISLKQLHSKCLYVDHLPQVRRFWMFLAKYFG